MKVLLDACVPRPLRGFLPDHEVRVAQEMGWGQLKNGALLKEAELMGQSSNQRKFPSIKAKGGLGRALKNVLT